MANKKKVINETDIKNISIPIIIAVIVFLCFSLILADNNKVLDNSKNPEVNNNDNINSKLNLSEEEAGNMINNILLVARDIYEKGTYTQFTKGSQGHYATLSQIRMLGYENIDSMVIGCEDGHAIMFFDVDHMEKYDDYPIMVVHECTGVTAVTK